MNRTNTMRIWSTICVDRCIQCYCKHCGGCQLCKHGEVRSTCKECKTSSVIIISISIRNISRSSMAESREDSMNENRKRKRENKGTEACRGVKTTEALSCRNKKEPWSSSEGSKNHERSKWCWWWWLWYFETTIILQITTLFF